MFTGFNLVYPEYEVITPQTHNSFHVRSLSVKEEERLKGSLVTPLKITEHLNKCLYESIVKKPDIVKDYESFLSNTTIKDREVILYGLYHISYEEVRNYDITCDSCKKSYPVTIQISNTFNFNPFPTDDVLTKKIKVNLPVSKGVSVYIKQPTLKDEIDSLRSLSVQPGLTPELITKTLVIDRFEQDIPERTEPTIFNDRSDIIDAYSSLPTKDRRVIFDTYYENFGKYGMELKMATTCIHCGNEEVVDIDLVGQFFRMVYSS